MTCIVVPFTCVLVSRNSHMYCLFQWSFHVNPMCCACSRLNGFVLSTHMCGNTSVSSESQMRFCFSIMFTCLTRFINSLFLNPKSPMCVLWSANHNSTPFRRNLTAQSPSPLPRTSFQTLSRSPEMGHP